MWKWLKSSKSPQAEPDASAAAPAERPQSESSGYRIIVITGASGSGRKYTARRLSEELGIPYVLPYTTRAIRLKEKDGEHYRFIPEEAFRTMEQEQAFFQNVRLERGSYGITREDLNQALSRSRTAIVVVNHDGAQAFHDHFGRDVIRIFIYVTKEDIRVRLEAESAPPELFEEYLNNYTDQIIHKRESEYLLQNMDREATVEKIKAFLLEKGIQPSV